METLSAVLIGSLQPLITLTILVSVRIGVMLSMLPAPFSSTSPRLFRAAFSLLAAFALAVPNVSLGSVPLEAIPLGRAAVGEALVGSILGLTARVTLAAADVAGAFAGFSMGLGFASTIDPMFGEQSTPTSRLLVSFATFIFFVTGGHHVLFLALAATLKTAPPGEAMSGFSADGVVVLGSEMITHGLRIAAPVIATLFIIQLGMGLVSRAAPKVQIFILSFAVAAGCGLISLYVAAPSVATALESEIQSIPDRVSAALGSGTRGR